MQMQALVSAITIAMGCQLLLPHAAVAQGADAGAPTPAAPSTPVAPRESVQPQPVQAQPVQAQPALPRPEVALPTPAPDSPHQGAGAPQRAQQRALAAERGRPLYLKYCATCHGRDGDGHGPSAAALEVAPLDFTRGIYKFRTTPAGMIPTQRDIERTIRLGLVGTRMPPWSKLLSPAEITLLAGYLMTLSDRFWTDEPPPPVLEIPAEPRADAASIARGQALFGRMGCPVCHGTQGHGDGMIAAALRDDWGKPIRPFDFHSASPKGGPAARGYYRTISTGHTGTPMPSFVALLKPDERWDVVHYVMSLRAPRGVLDYLLDPAGRMTIP